MGLRESFVNRSLLQKRLIILRSLHVTKSHVKTVALLKMSATGWLRLVGSFKVYVSFAEYRLFDRALLQNFCKRNLSF